MHQQLIDLLKQIPSVTSVNVCPASEATVEKEVKDKFISTLGTDCFFTDIRKTTGQERRYFFSPAIVLTQDVFIKDFVDMVTKSIEQEQTLTTRNFAPGPAPLLAGVEDAIVQAIKEDKLLEMSHRSPEFASILAEAKARLYSLSGLSSEDYDILFLQGGASLQFIMAPMNIKAYLAKDKIKGSYLVNGYWSQKAYEAGGQVCHAVNTLDNDSDFLHYVSNDTVDGIQVPPQRFKGQLIICDASSDFLTTDSPQADIIYVHAQKNLGISGVTIVFVKRELLNHSSFLPDYFNYKVHSNASSLFNTPPVVAIYSVLATLRVFPADVKVVTETKAKLLRDYLATSKIYSVEGNSNVNVCFTTEKKDELLTFLESKGIIGIEGHRSKGGLRVSLYIWTTQNDVAFLVNCLKEFEANNIVK